MPICHENKPIFSDFGEDNPHWEGLILALADYAKDQGVARYWVRDELIKQYYLIMESPPTYQILWMLYQQLFPCSLAKRNRPPYSYLISKWYEAKEYLENDGFDFTYSPF